jgi:hypothetical protein
MALERAGLTLTAAAWGTRVAVLLLSPWNGIATLIALTMYSTVTAACQIRAIMIRRSLDIVVRVNGK